LFGEGAPILVLDIKEAGAHPDNKDGLSKVKQLRAKENVHLLLQEWRLGFLKVILQAELLGVLLGLALGQGRVGQDGVRSLGLHDQALPGPRHELERADHGHHE
jgi:hypothetical protein